MAYIKSFTITNLAGQGGTTHRQLDRYLNIFWGLNGRGKTTLLQILNCALSNSTDNLHLLTFDSAKVVFYSEHYKVDITRTYTKVSNAVSTLDEPQLDYEPLPELTNRKDSISSPEPDKGKWETQTSVNLEDVTHDLDGGFQHTYLPVSRAVPGRIVTPIRTSSSNMHSENQTPEEIFADQVNQVWRTYSAQSNMEIRSIQQRGLASVLATLFGTEDPSDPNDDSDVGANQAFDLVQTFLIGQGLDIKIEQSNFTKIYNGSKEHRSVAAKIDQVRREVDTILLPQEELESIINAMYLGNKQVTLDPPGFYNSRPIKIETPRGQIDLRMLSSGEKQLLQLLIEVLAIGISTVMIDEPELSLHVDWQRTLVSSMSKINPNAQLLLATHSPEIMVDAPEDCVFQL